MKFRVYSSLNYEISAESTIILNIHALRTPWQTILEETFSIDPDIRADELVSEHGENRFMRLEIPEATQIRLHYSAYADVRTKNVSMRDLREIRVADLHPSIFPYLYPSRYCQSDKLMRFANNQFGDIKNPFEQVIALCDWIHDHVEYLSGSTNSQTSAFDTVTEQAGVCRDFAHLGIALCRALTIPARYFTGYSHLLEPQDFHACFEAYLNNEWIIFDATKLAPLNGLIKIASGRDAADTAVATSYGEVNCTAITVSSLCEEKEFEPYYYEKGSEEGLSYSA